MKKALGLFMTVALMAILVGSGFAALFSDTETVSANSFTAGSLDLQVNGEDDPISFHFAETNMAPGTTYNAGTITLGNVGTLSGVLTVMVSNPVSNENDLIEPEVSDGDAPGVQVYLTGYDANAGDGELWDQCKMKLYFDMNADGVMQWNEPLIYSGPMGLDMTSYYSIALDTNLWTPNHGFDGVLAPSGTVDLGLYVTFLDDQASPFTSQPQYNGMTNNQAMTDDMTFDLIIGLEQLP